ncbi:helix-turn-helix domain-containing protein [Deinococcus peraridilitoris]|nr:helix-turn-helix domain-containing protein [Deinococcus peraridilitoris]
MTVLASLATKYLPCIRLGQRYRFPRRALMRWIDEQLLHQQ